MYVLELEIHHKGCWGSEINLRFPRHGFSSIDCRWVKRNVIHIVQVVGNPAEFHEITKYLQRRGDVSRVEVLSTTKSILLLRVLTKKTKAAGQFSDIFFDHHCFPVAPTRFVNTSEIWTLGAANKKHLMSAYEVIKKRHFAKIISMKKENAHESLTEKQKEALYYAKLLGYYDWPRKRSATEISTLVGTPKTVFLSHLRKAEKKIISSYASRP